MKPLPTPTTAQAEAAWDIAVQCCKASAEQDQRWNFVRYVTSSKDHDLPLEHRFMGALGSGGKLYFDRFDGFRIGCYPEHMNDERRAMIDEANRLLTELNAGLSATSAAT